MVSYHKLGGIRSGFLKSLFLSLAAVVTFLCKSPPFRAGRFLGILVIPRYGNKMILVSSKFQ